jgi:hypothetical protein
MEQALNYAQYEIQVLKKKALIKHALLIFISVTSLNDCYMNYKTENQLKVKVNPIIGHDGPRGGAEV